MKKYEILKKLIEIDTVSDNKNIEIRDYLKKRLQLLNFKISEIGDDEKKKVLIAERGKSNIGFVCHTDTVSAGDDWEYNPYKLTIKDGYMYGLGVCDMKGGISALLDALSILDKQYPCNLYFTYDEEIGFEGIKKLIDTKKDFPKVLIFPEPTDLVPVIANKGCLEFEVTFIGKSAHSSTPLLGDNAILKAISFIDELTTINKTITCVKNNIFEIPETTFNLGKITGGDAINKVPQYCQISFDYRTVDDKQNKIIIKEISKLVKKYNAKIRIINDVLAIKNNNPKFQMLVEKICKQKSAGVSYFTEASFFKKKNILVLGPGPITAHQKDECILESSYIELVKKYSELIKKINEKN